jgi:hypothetical protein
MPTKFYKIKKKGKSMINKARKELRDNNRVKIRVMVVDSTLTTSLKHSLEVVVVRDTMEEDNSNSSLTLVDMEVINNNSNSLRRISLRIQM